MSKIQVGTMALRAPGGEFMPSVPIFREAITKKAKLGEDEYNYIPADKLADIFASRFKSYVQSRKK